MRGLHSREPFNPRFVLLHCASKVLTKGYLAALNTLVTLQNSYMETKGVKNVFQRYNRLRRMVNRACFRQPK